MDNIEAVSAAPELGQVEATEVGSVTESSAPSYDYINVDELGDKYVKVKVDGSELDVPVKEALSGYQRQADYTRKTQELATQRESLQFAQTIATALEQDPTGTLDLLSRHYGAGQPANQPPAVPEFADPLERQVWELNQKIQSFEQVQAQAQLEKEVNRLGNQYQDFNAPEVITQALRMGTDDLEAVYKQMSYDRLVREVEVMRQAQGNMTAQEQAIVDAKRNAAFVAGGSSANGAGTEPIGKISSVQDAWLAAKRQMGM